MHHFNYTTPNGVNTSNQKDINVLDSRIKYQISECQHQDSNITSNGDNSIQEDNLILKEDSSELRKCINNNNIIPIDDTCNVDTNKSNNFTNYTFENDVENLEENCRILLDFEYVFIEMQKSYCNHLNESNKCQFKDWTFLKEKTKKICLLSELYFKCNLCNHEATVWSEPKEDDYMDINTAAVNSAFHVGTGYQQMKEALAGMNVEFMTPKFQEISR